MGTELQMGRMKKFWDEEWFWWHNANVFNSTEVYI